MGKKLIELVVDDLTGDEIPEDAVAHTVTIEVDGKRRTLDLSDESKAVFDAEVGPWMQRGTRAPGERKQRPASRKNSPEFLAGVREWAREQGHSVSDRGRVPHDVMDAYRATL